ncbi:MAG TPA: hypothetical protein VFL99_01770 [Segeticoccus sp.]|uniref:hypothetical protein n=1 Tax=Segeticoccus sp. TaxID=2706531 RepID=UPI002D7FF2B6|nr:hypothetical protein [Segeticoccus sp.]HET8599023.1 hypothetical protein [Segeticoccus sp.]
MSPAPDLSAVLGLPGVAEATERAREACTSLRWHQALRRRTAEAAAESRVRGARASAALEGAEVDVDLVRDLVRGARPWPAHPDPVEETLRAAVRATAESERVPDLLRQAPAQALARLHLTCAGLVADEELGRPRQGDETARELADLGSAPSTDEVAQRLRGISDLVLADDAAPALVVAALVHAEIAVVRPFTRGNGLVARAVERALIQSRGLDPTGVAVPEVGHLREGTAGYVGALGAYAGGTARGVALWLVHCADAVVAGAGEGGRIADAVLAGRVH